MRVKRGDCVLLIIDVQEKLIVTISQKTELLENIKALVKTSEVLGMPILVTEQEKLGETLPELDRMLPHAPRFRKLAFSCCESSGFMGELRKLGRKTVIACGIEAHICVLQTVLDLLEQGYQVLVPREATSSYAAIDRDTAIERMRDAGAMITTAETAIYELTERAGTEEFRRVLEIVKERREAITP